MKYRVSNYSGAGVKFVFDLICANLAIALVVENFLFVIKTLRWQFLK